MITPDYNIIDIVFQDKTSLTFNLESCFQATPEIVSWKSGSYKRLNAGNLVTASIDLKSMHADHIKDRSKGGLGTVENARPAHPYCDSTYKYKLDSLSKGENA